MKTKIIRHYRSAISILLTICMLISCMTVGIIATDAAKVDVESTVGDNTKYLHHATSENGMTSAAGTALPCTINVSSGAFYVSVNESSSANAWTDVTKTSLPAGVYDNGDSSYNYNDETYKFRRLYFSTAMDNVTFSFSDGTLTVTAADEVTYTATVYAGDGGSVTAGKTSIAKNNSASVTVKSAGIKISATPESGKKFNGWTITGSVAVADASSASTTLTASGDGGTVTATYTTATTKWIYYNNSSTKWSQPYAYAWSGSGSGSIKYLGSFPGTKMTKESGNVWKVQVDTSAEYVIFSGTGGQTSNIPTNFTFNKPYYDTDNTWKEYTGSSTAENQHNATLGNTITSTYASSLYTNIKATFYDYYTSGEYAKGWYNGITPKEGWLTGDWLDQGKRNPYKEFNGALSDYAYKNGVTYPMYFLAEYYKADPETSDSYHYQGYNYENPLGKYINDSNQLGGNHKALTGLSGKSIADGDIHFYKNGVANENGAKMPMFDEDWLTSRGSDYGDNIGTLAEIVHSKFPVRKTTVVNGYDKIYLDISNTTWWVNDGYHPYAYMWKAGSDTPAVKEELAFVENNIYVLDRPTDYDKIIFYRATSINGAWDNQTTNIDIPAVNDSSCCYELENGTVREDEKDKQRGHWTAYSGAVQKHGQQTYYSFDSTNARDNIWFDNKTTATPVLQYGQGASYGVKNGYNDGYSFLPFDKYDDTPAPGKTGYGKDFGFGMKLEINFTLGQNGMLDDDPQVFEFSGDDDLWVYVDDQLVLDLGGAHARTQGSINFNTKEVKATPDPASIQTLASASAVTRNANLPTTFNNNNPDLVHKLTIYYMERGIHESNLKFGFSLSPVGNEFVSEKKVKTDTVNEGFENAAVADANKVSTIAGNESFTFTHTKSTTENGTYSNIGAVNYTKNDAASTTSTSNIGTYSMKKDDKADFVNKFTVGNWFNLSETGAAANKFVYDPSYAVLDMVTGDIKATGTGDAAKFEFKTTQENAGILDATRLNLIYTNEIATRYLEVTKKISNYQDSTTEFPIAVYLKFKGEQDTAYKSYPLKYSLDDGLTYVDMEKLNSSDTFYVIKVKKNQTALIEGIPKDATVKLIEQPVSGYSLRSIAYDTNLETDIKNSSGEAIVSLGDNNSLTVTNEKNTIKSHTVIEISNNNGTTYSRDYYQNDNYDYNSGENYNSSVNKGLTSGTKAYFTNSGSGNTSGYTECKLLPNIGLQYALNAEVDASGKYSFVGWYIHSGSTYTLLTSENLEAAQNADNETYEFVARFKKNPTVITVQKTSDTDVNDITTSFHIRVQTKSGDAWSDIEATTLTGTNSISEVAVVRTFNMIDGVKLFDIRIGDKLTIPNIMDNTEVRVTEYSSYEPYYYFNSATVTHAASENENYKTSKHGVEFTTGNADINVEINNKPYRKTVKVIKSTNFEYNDDSTFLLTLKYKTYNQFDTSEYKYVTTGKAYPTGDSSETPQDPEITYDNSDPEHPVITSCVYSLQKDGYIIVENVPVGARFQVQEDADHIGASNVTDEARFTFKDLTLPNNGGEDIRPGANGGNFVVRGDITSTDPVERGELTTVVVTNQVKKNSVMITKLYSDTDADQMLHYIEVKIWNNGPSSITTNNRELVSADDSTSEIQYVKREDPPDSTIEGFDPSNTDENYRDKYRTRYYPEYNSTLNKWLIPIQYNKPIVIMGLPVGSFVQITEPLPGTDFELVKMDVSNYAVHNADHPHVVSKNYSNETLTFQTKDNVAEVSITDRLVPNRTVTIKKLIPDVTDTESAFKVKVQISNSYDGTYNEITGDYFLNGSTSPTAFASGGIATLKDDDQITFEVEKDTYVKVTELVTADDMPWKYAFDKITVGDDATVHANGRIELASDDVTFKVHNKINCKYVIQYKYSPYMLLKEEAAATQPGKQSFTVSGTFTESELAMLDWDKTAQKLIFKSGSESARRTFLSGKAPYENNFMMDLTWYSVLAGETNSTYPEVNTTYDSAKNAETGEITITIQMSAIEKKDRTVYVYFDFPYEINTDTLTADDGVTYITDQSSYKHAERNTQYAKWITYDNTSDNSTTEKFITAPEYVMSGGTKLYFHHWQITSCADNKVGEVTKNTGKISQDFKKCYYREFNMTMYHDCKVVPVFMEGGPFSPKALSEADSIGGEAVITFIENSRNQWNENGSTTNRNTSNENRRVAGDRIYTDFLLTFGHNDTILNSGYEVINGQKKYYEPGFVLEQVGTVGEDGTKTPAQYKEQYKETVDKNKVKYYIDNTSVTKPDDYDASQFLANAKVSLSDLDNKNQMKYMFSVPARTDGTLAEDTVYKNYIYRAYCYLKAPNGTILIVSDPAYFTIYDMASITDANSSEGGQS